MRGFGWFGWFGCLRVPALPVFARLWLVSAILIDCIPYHRSKHTTHCPYVQLHIRTILSHTVRSVQVH